MLHLRLILAFALFSSFIAVAHGRSIIDPIGSPQTASAVSGDKGLGVDPNG
jgi:hypothetical protein